MFEAEEMEPDNLKGIGRPVRTYSIRRLIDPETLAESPIEFEIPGADVVRINTPELSLPNRLALIEDLKRAVHKLEGTLRD
jgi:hypothetical protein